MAFVLGMNGKLYQGAIDDALGSLIEVTKARDVTLNLTAGEADISDRGNSGWEATVSTLRTAGVDFDMTWDTTDARFAAIRVAFLASVGLEFAILDGDKGDSASQGPIATFAVTGFTRNEPLKGVFTVSVSLKLTVFKSWKDS